MNNKILKILNPILLIAFLVVSVSMIIYRIPGALQGDEIVGKIHALSGTLFILLAILHISLNWKWIKTQILGIKK